MVELNKEIKLKISELDCDQNIKNFLVDILENELDLVDETVKPGSAKAISRYKEIIKDHSGD